MADKQKWVALFEQVTGRKPSAAEFQAGKESQFDFKQIRSIAKLGELPQEQRVTTEQQMQPAMSAESSYAYQGEFSQPKPPVVNIPLTKKQKLKRGLIGFGILVAAGLGGGYYYMDSITGPQVVVDHFSTSFESNDYDQIAELLSSKEVKWSKEEAKGFLDYLQDQGIDPVKELQKLSDNGAKTTYNDNRGNKLLGLVEESKQLGIFSNYRIATYPVELLVSTNLDKVKVNKQELAKDSEQSLGNIKFAPYQLDVQTELELGEFETKVNLDLENIEQNKATVLLETTPKEIFAELPSGLSDAKDIKLIVNGKEVANGLTKEMQLFDYQEVEVYATFSYEDSEYTTEKTSVNLGSDKAVLVDLKLSKEVENRLNQARQVKETKEKAEQEAKERAEREKAELAQLEKQAFNFMIDYRNAMYSSINSGVVSFGDYYAPGASDYQVMVDYVETNRSSIRRQTSDVYDLLGFEKISDEEYLVHIRSKFTINYYNGKTETRDQNQTFTLRRTGDSFKITDKRVN